MYWMTNGRPPVLSVIPTHRSSTSHSRRFKEERSFLLLRGTTMNRDMQPDWPRWPKCWPTESARLGHVGSSRARFTFQGAHYASSSKTAQPIWSGKPRDCQHRCSPLEPFDAEAVRGGNSAQGGEPCTSRTSCRAHRTSHGALAERSIHCRRANQRRQSLVGKGQPSHLAGKL